MRDKDGWKDFDSAPDLEAAVVGVLKLFRQDDEPVSFIFEDAPGEILAVMSRDPVDPEVAVLAHQDATHEDGSRTRRFRCRSIERDGRLVTEVFTIDDRNRAFGAVRSL